MNSKGTKRNLKASQPGNHNAEKAGVYSERRRAEKASEVRKAIAKDPAGFLAQDPWDALAETVGDSELMAQDIAERGVTDRKGNLRRVVGAHARTLKMRLELNRQIEAGLAASAAEAEHAEPWSPAEGLRLLRDIAHNCISAPAARIKAIEILDERFAQAPSPATSYLHEFVDELESMSDEEFERELQFLSVPVTTGFKRGPEYEPRKMIQRLAAQDDIGREELRDLFGSLMRELPLDKHDPHETIRRLASQGDIGADELRNLLADLIRVFPLGA